MAILTILATSYSWLFDTLSWSSLGYLLLAVGIIATLLSGRRYLLGYLLGGMGYWVIIEGIQSILVNMTSISSGYSYAVALLLSWFVLGTFIAYRYKKYVATLPAKRTGVEPMPRRAPLLQRLTKRRTQSEKYIEHTPIYNNYKPRFRN